MHTNPACDSLSLADPDYFVALLWRQLVGARVLASALDAPPEVNSTAAVHAFCAGGGPPGAVVLAFINLADAPLDLALGGGLAAAPRVEFFLTAPGGNLTADAVLLNGAPLTVDAQGRLAQQPVPGRAVSAAGAPSLPPQSFGFIVLTAAAAPACA